MRKAVFAVMCTAVLSALFVPQVSAAVKPGLSCTKLNQVFEVGSIKYKCIKIHKKLVWSASLRVSTMPLAIPTQTSIPSPTPTVTVTPTPSPTPKSGVSKQGESCTRYSADVIGYDINAKLVDLMCNQFDDRYYPRPDGFQVNPSTGEYITDPPIGKFKAPDFSWTDALNQISNYNNLAKPFLLNVNTTISPKAFNVRAGGLERSAQFWSTIYRPEAIDLVLFTQDDKDWLYQNIYPDSPKTTSGFMAQPFGDNFCPSTTSLGRTGRALLARCVGGRWSAQDRYPGVLEAHEYTHMFQQQFNASQTGWLTEGSATFFGWMLGVESSEVSNARALSLANCRGTPKEAALLRNLQTPALDQNQLGLQYCLGSLATEYLIAKYGVEKFINFTVNFSSNDNFDSDFSKTYGLTVDKFYSDLQPYLDYYTWFW